MCGVNLLRQTQRSWVSSPIAIYQLLTTIKGKGVGNKYLQISDILQEKHEFQNETLYLRHVERSKSPTTSNVRGTNFQDSNEAISILNNWIKARGCGQNVLSNEWVCDKKWILANFCSYEGRWQMDKFTKMKIYNSFTYTEDAKYEARILEYPLHDEDFKMVMIVPNETDVMGELMETLITDGLRAAICKTQPSFVAETVAMAPDIEFTSELQAQDTQNNILIFEFGDVKINETGISITVFTGMSSGKQVPTIRTIDKVSNKFFFALTFRDTAIITGQYKYTKEAIK